MNDEETARSLAYQYKQEDIVESDSDDDEEYDWCRSVRSPTGLETALQIDYPDTPRFVLSTCMDELQIAPMFDGTQWAGTRIWPASVECLEYILRELDVSDTTAVLELGCGLGLPGMLLNLLRNCPTVLTDKSDLVPQLRDNLKQEAFEGRLLQAHALDWSESGVDELLEDVNQQKFDIVFNCDCVYVPLYGDSYKALIDVQLGFLRKNPQTILLTSVERRRVDGIDSYLDGLKASDLVDRVELLLTKGKVEIYRAFGRSS